MNNCTVIDENYNKIVFSTCHPQLVLFDYESIPHSTVASYITLNIFSVRQKWHIEERKRGGRIEGIDEY